MICALLKSPPTGSALAPLIRPTLQYSTPPLDLAFCSLDHVSSPHLNPLHQTPTWCAPTNSPPHQDPPPTNPHSTLVHPDPTLNPPHVVLSASGQFTMLKTKLANSPRIVLILRQILLSAPLSGLSSGWVECSDPEESPVPSAKTNRNSRASGHSVNSHIAPCAARGEPRHAAEPRASGRDDSPHFRSC